jgi:hypothetical protein
LARLRRLDCRRISLSTKKETGVPSTISENSCIAIEARPWGDVQFYGEWLLAVAEAEIYWREACRAPNFAKKIDILTVAYIPNFGIAALQMVLRLKEYRLSFVLDVASEEAEHFVMMLGMGFFARNGQHYRITVPPRLTVSRIKAAALRYAKTADREFMLHPERLVTVMPFSEAQALQRRLLAIDDFQSGYYLGNA